MRSKFQTERRMGDAAQGEPVEVPFDETIVRYLWRGERDFLVVSVELRSARKDLLEIESKLKAEGQGQEKASPSPSPSPSTSHEDGSSSRSGDVVESASGSCPQQQEAEQTEDTTEEEGAVFVDATAF